MTRSCLGATQKEAPAQVEFVEKKTGHSKEIKYNVEKIKRNVEKIECIMEKTKALKVQRYGKGWFQSSRKIRKRSTSMRRRLRGFGLIDEAREDRLGLWQGCAGREPPARAEPSLEPGLSG